MLVTRRLSTLALLATTYLATPVVAQTTNAEQDVQALQAEVAALRAQIAALAAKVDAAAAKPVESVVPTQKQAAAPANEVKWKGAPETTNAEGWSFKPRGRIHLDAGYVSASGALNSRNVGFTTRARRIRLGFEGTMPGEIGYKAEADFANAGIAFGDVLLSYSPKNTPVTVRVGNFESLNSMEQISSSNSVTFIERSAFNDAFINARRLGAAVAVHNKNNDFVAEFGLFSGHAIDNTLDNDGWIGAARVFYAPKIGDAQLHLGATYQYRDFSSNNAGVASASLLTPSVNQLARYRARPVSQLTDIRFVDTGSFAAKSDQILGFEAAMIFPKFYINGEAQWLKAKGYDAGNTATGLDAFSVGNVAVTPAGNPDFFGIYAEIGTFLTGETRGYNKKLGIWSRPKVANPINKGGSGAFQLAARFDYLDLDSSQLKSGLTNNFTTGISTLAAIDTRLGRGGTQTSYLLGLNWYPMDYVRFMVNYSRSNVKGGPLAATVLPLSTDPVNARTYGVDVLATRLQVEF